MRREPNYLYLLICLLTGVAFLITFAPQSLLHIGGVLSIMMVSAYILAERKGQMLLATLLGTAAVLPFVWHSLHPQAGSTRLAQDVYALTLGCWLPLTFYIGQIAFRSILAARRIRHGDRSPPLPGHCPDGIISQEFLKDFPIWSV